MQKLILLTLSALTLVVTSVVLSSCGKDDEKPAKPILSFSQSAISVDEKSGTATVTLQLNKELKKNLRIEVDVDSKSTATEGVDFDLEDNSVVIRAGETEAEIEISITQDNLFEGNETIILEIDDVDNESIDFGQDEIKITIKDVEIGFSDTELTIDESTGLVQLEVTLSEPATEDLTIGYSIGGTATELEDDETGGFLTDYLILGNYLELEIEEGETTGVISFFVFSDDYFENNETIEIQLNAEGPKTKIDIEITQEDGIIVYLGWHTELQTDADGQADMDLIVHIGETDAAWEDAPLTGSVYRGYDEDYEFVFIPNNFNGDYLGLDYTDVTYGLSYNYYNGTMNPLKFQVEFAEFIDGEFEASNDIDIFQGEYTLSNIYTWSGLNFPTIIAQTFKNVNKEFTDISEIAAPQATGSRKGSNLSSKKLIDILKRPELVSQIEIQQRIHSKNSYRKEILKKLNNRFLNK